MVMPSGHVKGSHKKKASPEKTDNDDYSKPLTSEALPNKSMQEWQSMPSGELEKADKEVTTKYMKFLRKYAAKH